MYINPKSRLIIYCNLSTFEEITCVCNAVVSVSEGFTIYMFNDASIMLIEIGVFKTHKIVHVNLGGRGYHPSSNDPIKQKLSQHKSKTIAVHCALLSAHTICEMSIEI